MLEPDRAVLDDNRKLRHASKGHEHGHQKVGTHERPAKRAIEVVRVLANCEQAILLTNALCRLGVRIAGRHIIKFHMEGITLEVLEDRERCLTGRQHTSEGRGKLWSTAKWISASVFAVPPQSLSKASIRSSLHTEASTINYCTAWVKEWWYHCQEHHPQKCRICQVQCIGATLILC
jgi:hypothetical protein